MALLYSMDPGRRRVTVTATAQPTYAEFSALIDTVVREPAFELGDDILWDRRSYIDVPTREYIERIVVWWQRCLPRLGYGRVANVVPGSRSAAYGMARMAELMGKPDGHLRAFNDIAEAIRWLDERFAHGPVDQIAHLPDSR
jgi:hypothetical protein